MLKTIRAHQVEKGMTILINPGNILKEARMFPVVEVTPIEEQKVVRIITPAFITKGEPIETDLSFNDPVKLEEPEYVAKRS